jgi:hypothetical protein
MYPFEDSMKRKPAVYGIVAALLAVLLPLEQAHCAWMNFQPPVSASGERSGGDHSCCASSDAPQKTAPAPLECACVKLPAAALTTDVVSASAPLAASPIAELPEVAATFIPGSAPALRAPLDVGSPPLPDDPGAHGLRAPPLSA